MLFCLLSENMSSAKDRWHLWGLDGLLWKTKFCCLMHRPEKQRMLEILRVLGCSCGTLAGHYELFLRKEKKTQNWNMQDMYHKDSWLHSFIWNWWINTSIWVYTSLICVVFDLWCAAVTFRETQQKLLQLCSKIYNIKFYVSAITCFRSCSRWKYACVRVLHMCRLDDLAVF